MMKKLYYYTFVLFISIVAGCKVDDEFDGPSLVDQYGQFAIVEGLSVSNYNVDFSSNQAVAFHASFTKSIEWTLKVKGLQSGAIKELTGFSNLINAANATWNGTISQLPMFKMEECAIELTFLNEPDTLVDTLSIAGNRVNAGLLLSDFENGVNAGWEPFAQAGTNMSFQIQNSPTSAQGNNYFDIGGEVDWDWLIGLIDMPATAYGAPTFDLSSNPNDVYFNVMLYKPEGLTNGIMLFQFREDDNGDGVYTENAEDMFSIEIHLTENGWKQHSVKYADLATLINGAPAAPLGNGVYEPNKLLMVSALFLANPNSGYSQAYMDYIIFTQGGPLVP